MKFLSKTTKLIVNFSTQEENQDRNQDKNHNKNQETLCHIHEKQPIYWDVVFNLLEAKDESRVRSPKTSAFINAYQFTLL